MHFSKIVNQLGQAVASHSLTSYPNLDPEIAEIQAIETATPNSLSYIEGGRFARHVSDTVAKALILPIDESLQAQATARGIAWMSAPNPRLLFAQTIALFYKPFKPSPGIHATAVIDPSAQVGEGVAIGAHVVIQANASIGNHVCIHPNVVIYPDAVIGDRTLLHANCVIHERAQIGADCVIHSGAVIGSDGFGFVPTASGWVKMEQSGYVVLGDGVEIGCNTCIDRPAVGVTSIGAGSKLDNLIQIGHGCQVGQKTVMAAQVGMAGGTTIGQWVMLGGQVGIANNSIVGDRAQIMAQSGILGDVEPGAVMGGSPVMPSKIYLKVAALLPKLPEIYKTLQTLRKQMEERFPNP
jgi:UDP-3-O-[3-hydroxymyristoyl] glucosamine N-acyltransferase